MDHFFTRYRRDYVNVTFCSFDALRGNENVGAKYIELDFMLMCTAVHLLECCQLKKLQRIVVEEDKEVSAHSYY